MTGIHLCAPEDLDRLLPLVARCHDELGIESDDAQRRAAIAPLLDDTPLGAVWLMGLARAPVGYIVVTFCWSVAAGGMEGIVDDIFIRPNVRGRGIATEALSAVAAALQDGGLKALHLQVDGEASERQRLFARAGFSLREGSVRMSRRF